MVRERYLLFAGGCADNAPVLGGALAFDVSGPPSWAFWDLGSAKNSQYRASTLYTGLSKKEYVK